VTESDKHSSLLRYKINYGRKRFYDAGPRSFTFYLLQPSCRLTNTDKGIELNQDIIWVITNDAFSFPRCLILDWIISF